LFAFNPVPPTSDRERRFRRRLLETTAVAALIAGGLLGTTSAAEAFPAAFRLVQPRAVRSDAVMRLSSSHVSPSYLVLATTAGSTTTGTGSTGSGTTSTTGSGTTGSGTTSPTGSGNTGSGTVGSGTGSGQSTGSGSTGSGTTSTTGSGSTGSGTTSPTGSGSTGSGTNSGTGYTSGLPGSRVPQGGTLTIGSAQGGMQGFGNEIFNRFGLDRDASLGGDDALRGRTLAFADPDPSVLASLGLTLPAKTDAWVWGRLYGERASVTGNGASNYKARGLGGAGGIEIKPDPDALLGIAFGIGHSRLSGEAGDEGKLDSYRLGVYSQYYIDPVFFGVTLNTAYNRGDVQSAPDPLTHQYLSGSFGGYQFGLSAMGGYRLTFDDLTVEPWMGFDYERLHQNAFTQSGPGFSDLHVDALTLDTGRLRFATRLKRAFTLDDGKLLELNGQIGWAHDIMDVTPTVTQQVGVGTPFVVTGVKAGRDALFGGLGTKLTLPDGTDFTLDFSGETKDKAWSYVSAIGVRVKW